MAPPGVVGPMPGRGLAVAAVVLALAGAPAWAALDALGPLPAPRAYAASATDGGTVWLLGGLGPAGRTDGIVAYDTRAGTAQTLAARLPSAREAAAAVWTGQHVYVLGGGQGAAGALADVVRFDPATGSVQTVASLPSPREGAAAAWAGGKVWLFGGWNPTAGFLDEVVRFDPASNVAQVVARLPAPLWQASAVGAGDAVYVAGGYRLVGGVETSSAQVLRFDPATQAFATAATLPQGRYLMAGSWSGAHLYLLGGVHHLLGATNQTLRVEAATGAVEALADRLPSKRFGAAGAWAADAAWAFGGTFFSNGTDVFFDTALRLTPPPPNRPPVAHIAPVSPAECLAGGAVVRLDGSGSSDPDGDGLTWRWSAPGIAFDDATSRTPSARFPLGSTTVTLDVGDGRRNATATAEVRVQDTLPPTTTLALDGLPGDDGWWRSGVQATLEAADACGPAIPRYALDGGPWTDGDAVAIAGDGAHALRYASTDPAGNAESPRAEALRLDATPPTVALLDPRPGYLALLDMDVRLHGSQESIVLGPKTVRADPADATSGVARVTFAVDGAPRATASAAPWAWTWPAGREAAGWHTVEARARDAAGNEAAAALRVLTLPTTLAGLAGTECRPLLAASCAGLPPLPPRPPLPDEEPLVEGLRAALRQVVQVPPICLDGECLRLP